MNRGVRVLLAATLTAHVSASQPPTDAARVLADVRQALGGDAAIAAVRSFSVSGMEDRSFGGRSATASIELVAELPDKFVMVRRVPTPFSGDNVETHGFNGDARVSRRISVMPYPPNPYDKTPALRAEADRRALLGAKQEFSRLAVALIGLVAAYPLDAAYEGQQKLDGRSVDVLRLTAPDGYTARLYVDAATHLPSMISWMGMPHIVMSVTTIETVRRGEGPGRMPPPFPPSGDPAAGRAMVERRLSFSDFKLADGLNWPHRLKEVVDGEVITETRLGKYKINPKLDPKRFEPAR
jgi:hypothetical protein